MRKSKDIKKIYFLILIITTISSYIILSIDKSELFSYFYKENQMLILDKVNLIYGTSLFFVFILIYYSSFYLIFDRRKEIGLYIGEGIDKKTLFYILFRDKLRDIIQAYFIGISLALFINEFINLFTIKLLKLGLDNHKFSISLKALILSLLICILINTLSNFFIVKDIYRLRPDDIYRGEIRSKGKKFLFFSILVVGIFYIISRSYIDYLLVSIFIVMVFLIYLAYKIIEIYLKKNNTENIFLRKHLLMIFSQNKSSLVFTNIILILALFFFSSTCLISIYYNNSFQRPADFTLYDDEEKILDLKDDPETLRMMGNIYPVYLSDYYQIGDQDFNIKMNEHKSVYREMYITSSFLLKESSFKKIYQLETSLKLADDETVILTSFDSFIRPLESYIKTAKPTISVNNDILRVCDKVYSSRIFSNDTIGFAGGLVVSDSLYDKLIENKKPFAYNLNLSKSFVNSVGFTKASDTLRDKFIKSNYKYESYIWQAKNGMGMITESLYTRLYVGFVFFIAGLSFLAIRLFLLFEQSKESLLILKFLGEEEKNIKKMIIKEYKILFYIIVLISLIVNFFISRGYVSFNGYGTVLSDILMNLILLALSFIVLIFIRLFINFIFRMTYERISEYEENTYN